MVHIWLRDEVKPFEKRTALTPRAVEALVAKGFQVTVESSQTRIFKDSEYEITGCDFAESGSWVDAPKETYVLGLKELPTHPETLSHKHIYFAHAYKNQDGWQDLLKRFHKGQGEILDLEFLTCDRGRRVAAFGYWAGFVGTALAVKAWIQQQKAVNTLPGPCRSYVASEELVDEIKADLQDCPTRPRVIVIGAKGRCGHGATELCRSLHLETLKWDRHNTEQGGPFDEILEHEIFVNAVYLMENIPPFFTRAQIQEARRLSVICDVSCDPNGPHNPLPIYEQITTMEEPVHRLAPPPNVLDLVAIDHLPSLLPRESSEDFSEQLLPHLFELQNDSQVWQRARDLFHEISKSAGI